MIRDYIKSLFLIFAAEMGDKTQILAMMFATRYSVKKVLMGVGLGSLLNHGLAVAFGALLGKMIPSYILQMVAGFAFLIFSFMTLQTDQEDEEETSDKSRFTDPIILVATAFFVGELGDKTQLTAITLSVSATYPLFVLMGTVSGMLLTSGIGIFVGSKIGDKLPEMLIKVLSATIFMVFGLLKLLSATPSNWINGISVTVFLVLTGLLVTYLLRTSIKAHQQGLLTPYTKAVRALYNHAHVLEESINNMCMGVAHCGKCDQEACAVGFMKHLIKDIKRRDYKHDHQLILSQIYYQEGKFNKDLVKMNLHKNMAYLKDLTPDMDGYLEADMFREVLEMLLIGRNLPYEGDYEAYMQLLEMCQ